MIYLGAGGGVERIVDSVVGVGDDVGGSYGRESQIVSMGSLRFCESSCGWSSVRKGGGGRERKVGD